MANLQPSIQGSLRTVYEKENATPQFEEWSRFASELRNKALAEQIKFEDYYAEIRK